MTALLVSSNPKFKDLKISALVRKQEHAEILEEKGVNSIVFDSLDNIEVVRKVASEHDIVINTANSFHHQSAEAIILGLADRRKQTGRLTHLIHTSGTSALGDHPITGSHKESRVFSDEEDIYTYQRKREDNAPYPLRTTDLVVYEKGDAAGVKTYILMSPTIYGIGSGLFNRTSIQIDVIMRAARRTGFTPVIGPGPHEWDHVHIEDLVRLYEVILTGVLTGTDLPSNKQGIYFNETGHQSWREVSERVANSGKETGYLTSSEVREVSLDEGAAIIGYPPLVTELGFASRSRTQALKSRRIGWKPTKTRADFEASFAKEWEIIGKEAL